MKKIFKPLYFFTVLSLLLLTAGFGCKGLSAEQQAAIKPVNLEYWTVFDDVDALQSLIVEYRTGRPYINVTVRQLRSDELYQRLIEALADDRSPDIISVNSRSLGQFQTKLAAMPPSVKDAVVQVTQGTLGNSTQVLTQTVPLPTIDQLDREYVQAVSKDVVRNGNIYGLPLSVDTMAVYYNKDLLDRAGVAEPPKNWEEFQADVKKITRFDKASGKIIQAGAALGTGSNISGSDDIISILFKQSGIDMIDKGGQVVFNIPPRNQDRSGTTPSMTVLNFYTDFANPNRDTYSWNEQMGNALDSFVSGRTAFFFGYSYHLPIIQSRAPQLNFRVLPLFQLNQDQPVNAANYWMQTVVAKSKHPNEAWGLVNFLTHSKATQEYLDKTGRPTAIRSYIPAQREKKELKPFVDSLLVAESWYRGSNYEAASRAVNDMIHDWLQDPPNPDYINQYRQDILDRTAARINQTL